MTKLKEDEVTARIRKHIQDLRTSADTLEMNLQKQEPEIGDGYYQLPLNSQIKEYDEVWNYVKKAWERITFAPLTVESNNTIYRRQIQIAHGWERVPAGNVSQKGDKKWSSADFEFVLVENVEWEGYTIIDAFVIRPIPNKYANPDWYKGGMLCLQGNGTADPGTPQRGYILRGRSFDSLEELHAYSNWEVKNAARLRSLQVLEDRISELNDGWVPDWEGQHLGKYVFASNHVDSYTYSIIYHHETLQETPNSLCFKLREIGEQLIKEFGEAFLKTALGF